MIKKLNDMDNINLRILEFYKDNPNISLKDMGKKLNRSQPSIGNRVRKLKEDNLISQHISINFIKCGFSIGLLFLDTNDDIINFKYNNIINSFITTGKYNIIMMIYGISEDEIYKISKTITKKFNITKHKLEFIINTNNCMIPL